MFRILQRFTVWQKTFFVEEHKLLRSQSVYLVKHRRIRDNLVLDGFSNYSKKWEHLFRTFNDSGKHNIVYSMEGVSYLGDIGMALFFRFQHDARQAGGDIRLCHVDPKIVNILHLMDPKDDVIKIYQTETDA